MRQHLLLVPSLACPAACAYCFGPHKGGASMSRETVEAVVAWQSSLGGDGQALEITFHGGEPLVPGAEYYRMALPLLRQGLGPRRLRFAMQSNLWLLTDELAELLREYGVSLGTSLDGPEAINDAQRGAGYFRRTMASIERARRHGLDVGCICTFTPQSLPHIEEILSFFIGEGLNFTLHAALPVLGPAQGGDDGHWSLSPQAHGELLVQMLDLYLAQTDRVRIGTLDSLCRSVSAGRGGICTFGDCLGEYLAVGPDGAIYPCQRFAGKPEYVLGSVHDDPTPERLAAAPTWRAFAERQERIKEECGDCLYLDTCRGGCPYNALAAGGGACRQLRDPHCAAYRRIFSHITERATAEVLSAENIAAVVERPDPERGLLRHGRLLALMRDGPHPYETAGRARLILGAVALAATGSAEEATRCFERLGLVTRAERTGAGMAALQARLTAPLRGLNNLYLHVTFACPLHCTHCYAEAGPPRQGAMPVEHVSRACREASALGFRHAVITGGEPLVHPQRDALLDALAALRREVKPLLTVLRTSLSVPASDELLRRVSCSTDQVVVSLDGDRETHDARRGAGSYDLVVANLRRLVAMGGDTDLSLATVLPLQLANGPPGDAVRALARELGIRRTRFRPLLPLGRAVASELDIVPETLWGHMDPREMVAYGFHPVASCGMGQNLYVEPDGQAYPCYAWHGEAWRLGSLDRKDGLPAILASPAFRDLGRHTVDSNRGCRECALRYLCGGACRAWSRLPDDAQTDLDAAPRDCAHLQARARSLLLSALEHLGITEERWREAGLAGLEPLNERMESRRRPQV
jgi:uncharacterized protein